MVWKAFIGLLQFIMSIFQVCFLNIYNVFAEKFIWSAQTNLKL